MGAGDGKEGRSVPVWSLLRLKFRAYQNLSVLRFQTPGAQSQHRAPTDRDLANDVLDSSTGEGQSCREG